jgi:peptide/nickel transport system permease protein
LTPGDPIALVVDPTMLSPDERAAVRQSLGLDDPLPLQYAKMMEGVVDGNLRSFKTKQPTIDMVFDAFPVTLLIGGSGLIVALLFGLPIGGLAARRPGGIADRFVSLTLSTSLATPPFALGLVLVLIFTVKLHLLPGSGIAPIGTVGFDGIHSTRYLLMPVAVIAFGQVAIFARYVRDALVDVLANDYIRTARAKGLAEPHVMLWHAARNAMLPIVALLNTMIPVTLGGAVVIETVFGLPGLGALTTKAALSRDYPVVMTTVLFVACLNVFTNLIVDLAYGWIDPRTRLR